jgi:RNA polymerase sigma-70 factor (sigma-E family)
MLTAKVDRLAAVHQSTIAELYLRHVDAAVRLAYLLTGDREMAEDLAQDAFVKATGRLAHLRNPDAFDAYLRTTIVNLARSYFRRKRVERSYLERAKRIDRPESYLTPSRSVEEQDQLWQALRRLNQRQRAAIVLRFYEDLPEGEVAEILQCAPGTVKSLVSRGLEKLRNEIEGEDS